MYVKANGDVIETFPYSLNQLKADNPDTSFPKEISEALLLNYNVFPVVVAEVPSTNPNQVADQNSAPDYLNGVWVLGWTIRLMNQQETDSLASEVRLQRNLYLDASDWTQMSDSPLDDATKLAWANYRKALRDITTQADFPYTVTWPTAP